MISSGGSGIARSKEAAKAFVERLVMQNSEFISIELQFFFKFEEVFDVLEQQGRSALLPDAVISGILNQLRVQINYDPWNAKAQLLLKIQIRRVVFNLQQLFGKCT
ncbi:hypothetical protein KIN20_028009 [Parelaphostrongylus tenuis]|uniref:Uncharacterized protein n=1 Tax=Parelaphostrongylus tenuis TaxID=148309 RepID=A0AAD5R036_PARTN|nr:hypothetical protein KIN20_028009 [Parelaphostrongylus tenuis]